LDSTGCWQIIVWRAVGLDGDNVDHGHYSASHMLRLTGHEGSIFRIVWSLDGSKIVSVSDDRRWTFVLCL